MKPGMLRVQGIEAIIDSDGWRCQDERLLELLRGLYSPPPTTAGTPWIIAFWRATEGLQAKVLQEPAPDELPSDVVA